VLDIAVNTQADTCFKKFSPACHESGGNDYLMCDMPPALCSYAHFSAKRYHLEWKLGSS
jgi:hypothetical protein